MKKVFGWFFIISGIIGVFGLTVDVTNAGMKIFVGIGMVMLGIWMVSSSKSNKNVNN